MTNRLQSINIKGVTSSTLHALAVKLLFRNGFNFSIYADDDVLSIVKRLCKKNDIIDKEDISEIITNISLEKDNLISPSNSSYQYRNIYQEYEDILARNNAKDFADLILDLVRITKNKLSYNHILVDEAQDLSYSQVEVIKNLYKNLDIGDTLTIIADGDQELYNFRNSQYKELQKFMFANNVNVISLGDNFRSTRNIVNYSKKLISNNRGRVVKNLKAFSSEYGKLPEIREFNNSNDEAEFIIKECKKSNEIAILYRSNWMSQQIELELQRNKMNYYISDSIKFLDRKEIKDILSYLRVAINGNDKESLIRSIQSPKRGVGSKFFAKINTFNDIIDCEKLQNYISLIYDIRENKDNAVKAINLILTKTEYLGITDEKDRIRNLNQLISVLIGKTLEEAMYELTGGSPGDEDINTVNLMTLHSSKGTEFNKVIIIGCEEGCIPHINNHNIDEERRLFYVGITRAKKEIIMTYSRRRLMFGNYQTMHPSRFFKELKC